MSYAHKDSDTVLPVIARLQKDGYRVWYDEGIVPGSNWDEYISSKLDKCSVVLCFISNSYIKSQNCKDELALSRQKKKPMNIVYTDNVQLSPGLKMRYGRIQALFMNSLTEEELYQKLYTSATLMDSKE